MGRDGMEVGTSAQRMAASPLELSCGSCQSIPSHSLAQWPRKATWLTYHGLMGYMLFQRNVLLVPPDGHPLGVTGSTFWEEDSITD